MVNLQLIFYRPNVPNGASEKISRVQKFKAIVLAAIDCLFLAAVKLIWAFCYYTIQVKTSAMKKLSYLSVILLVLCLSSCSVIAGIFKAGAVVGIISVIVVIAIIIWIIFLFRK